MRKGITWVLLLGFVVSLGFVAAAQAQATKDTAAKDTPKTDTATKEDRIEGYVLELNKDKSEFTVRQSKSLNVQWTVVYTPDTKFSFRNTAAKIDEVQKGRRVICMGSFGTEKTRLTATRVDVRTDK